METNSPERLLRQNCLGSRRAQYPISDLTKVCESVRTGKMARHKLVLEARSPGEKPTRRNLVQRQPIPYFVLGKRQSCGEGQPPPTPHPGAPWSMERTSVDDAGQKLCQFNYEQILGKGEESIEKEWKSSGIFIGRQENKAGKETPKMSRFKRKKGSQTDRQKGKKKKENCDTVAIPIMTLTGLQSKLKNGETGDGPAKPAKTIPGRTETSSRINSN